MSWAQRLKRVFGIDIQICPACGGALRIIACIEAPVVIATIVAASLFSGWVAGAVRRGERWRRAADRA